MDLSQIELAFILAFNNKLACLLAILVFYLLITAIYYAYIHPLAKVPGPKLYAVTQIPYFYHITQGSWLDKLNKLHDQYGPVVRFAPNDISFITANAVKIIYGSKAGGFAPFDKDLRMYRHGNPVKDIVTAGHEDHKRIRRHLAYAFSIKALRDHESILNQYADKFISKLCQRAGTDVDMVAWFNYVTFDVMGHLSLGQPFGCIDTGHYHPWITLILSSLKAFSFITVIARLGFVQWILWLIPTHQDETLKNDLQFVDRAASTRLNTGDTKSPDIMSYILRHDDGKGMSKAEILENASLLIAAGGETTASLLSGTTYYLLTNPDKYKTLVDEIRSTFTSEDEITLPRVNQLQYLLAVLNEGLRIYPPSATGLARITPPGGKSIEGYWIPENTSVSVPHQSAYLSAYNFKDPRQFIPERWLGDTKYASDNRDVLQPFSTGPRDCIGKSFAYAEMRLLLTRLLWRFDLELLPQSKDWIVQKVYFLHEKPEMHVRMTEVVRGSLEIS
ncbi:related to isotrichodermin C-15 hydroxylase (cytochrome P-450 monooxygenase CYP65A1) [Fusarium fujikuroi]|uniref:Related to isotrichodermin C-15 hydroxylase (Cytochrome P-450 monooxygenase CYP65A1) n=1 Tax=Gibberella fujikuroi (strain CBS 195.34 / IMI 58289 / NRRL A-6831) TaxID=1279085 RepID=S0ENY7_GIBF5|nr:related to isotrichodermin C-15 hydroxylase (cytochrome P-450 monooxygenase CYP65A1) [Fusarium fujikuroi IMI 58289]KLP04348.1 isotrichodermin C-15 hydroxylase (cytochrome P-450 monooxygenase CYP65A1) [Fusarium fujikuroi]KLP20323.1 isotrichodermin C-15 hydroxylase (cytochrome P-450 monooxygenase CYP65A1) [Fusarium fujikuroi]QGI71257.1 hypothetical protein CEK27_003586 [Fusarium fujikuroi]CCT76004.1 related to isotrichodermin C-15 hydroxylase (cytochrome P-450 monooxygenase CYP65A1) [Fusarium 